ncbi:hypothetical protein B0T09DRAFT_289163 [Sordaria sp. MPI-SDFR-AT-0083]|nr:hypothetical protein B0T09DRAFT_289163 [Sordaria sp. MPI-SDFR-AT-0083]
MARLSGLQKEVLGLYRKCLRECRKKPEATRDHFKAFARTEFEKNIKVDKRDFSAIEFLLRKGSRQLETPSIARRAAEEVFRKPLSLSLQKLRRAQAKRHATKVRVSFVHSNGSQNRLSGSARKRSSSQRKQQPSPPKRGANGGAIPGIWQDINYKGGGPRQLPKKKSRGSYPKFGPSDASSSQEDQCCLGSPSKKDAEKPPGAYWGELSRSPVKSPPKVPNQPGEEPSLYFSRDRRSVIKLRPLPPLPKGPSAPMPRPRPNPGTPTSRGKAVARPSPVRPGALQTRKIPMHTEAWVPPETWGSTNRQLKPNKKGSPGGKDRASKNRHIVSRFCNHRKVSNRPIELEEAQPASGASKLPHPPPAIGETQKSIRTVKELLPYQDQFRAAGLAVTSKEQKAFHRRGKLAPLLGKMSPSSGSEWLRLDGGTETNEIVTEVKKDDSPSPINVEQIPLKSGEDKLSNASSPPESVSKGLSSPGHQSDRQTPCSMHDEEKENIIPTAQPSPAPNPEGIPNSDKTLPALPRVFSQVLVRHGSGPSRNSSWSAAMRQGQFPPTIVEQREPSLDKQQEQRQQPKKRHQPTPTSSILSATSYETAAIVQPAKSYGQLPLQIRNTRQNSVSEVTVITTKTPHPSVVSSIELPKSVVSSMELPGSVRTRTGTPSSLEKALDEAVRRLQAMRETVVANPGTVNSKTSPTSRSKGTGKGKYQHKRSTSSKTVPSPSQKLRMAKALRKEKMFGAAVAVAVGDDHSPRSKPSSPASTCTALVKREDDMRSSLASMGTVEREEGQEVRGRKAAVDIPVLTLLINLRHSSALAKGLASSPTSEVPVNEVLPTESPTNVPPPNNNTNDHQPAAKPAHHFLAYFTPIPLIITFQAHAHARAIETLTDIHSDIQTTQTDISQPPTS